MHFLFPSLAPHAPVATTSHVASSFSTGSLYLSSPILSKPVPGLSAAGACPPDPREPLHLHSHTPVKLMQLESDRLGFHSLIFHSLAV